MNNWRCFTPNFYMPNTLLIANGNTKITVALAEDILDYIIEKIERKNLANKDYKKAKNVFSSIKMILNNQTPKAYSKDDMKRAIDVYKEILNEEQISENEKEYNENMALLCKWVIETNPFFI